MKNIIKKITVSLGVLTIFGGIIVASINPPRNIGSINPPRTSNIIKLDSINPPR